MKVNGRIGIASILMFILVSLAATVSAIDLEVTKTEINGVEVFPDDFVHLDLQRGDNIEVEIEFVSLDDLEDVEIRTIILSSEEDIEEVLPLFDTREDTEYKKTIALELPREVEEDEYRLMVIISDKDDEELSETYNIFVNSERHNLAIEDVVLQPFGRVVAGEYLLSKVRIENFGQDTENDVRVVISIPELGVQAVSYIDEIDFDDQEETEEMLLRIPQCADAKQYRLNVVVEYNEGRDHVTQEQSIFVDANQNCENNSGSDSPAVVVIRANDNEASGAAALDTEENQPSSTRKALEVVLGVLVVLLLLIALLIGFMKLRRDE